MGKEGGREREGGRGWREEEREGERVRQKSIYAYLHTYVTASCTT